MNIYPNDKTLEELAEQTARDAARDLANQSAFPLTFQEVDATGMPRHAMVVETGMTKREYFAAKAMQGLLANPNIQIQLGATSDALGIMRERVIALASCAMADGLISELNNTQPAQP